MGSLKTLALAGAALAAASVTASAADLRGPIPIGLPPAPIAAPIAEASGWYLRGDVGVGEMDSDRFKYTDNPAGLTFRSKNFDSPIFGGIGIGYQVNSWLRFDVTGEYRGKTGFQTHDSYQNAGIGCGGFYGQPAGAVTCTNSGQNLNRGSVSSLVLMANAYLDLGTWYGLTPFIGGGVGVTQNRVSGVVDTGYTQNVVTATTIPAIAPIGQTGTSPTFGSAANGNKTNFAWALMAGVGYDVTQNLKLELSYRYLNLGKMTTGTYACAGGCGTTYALEARNLDSHDFRFGMRWMLGGPTYAAAPPPAYPIVKKY